MPKRCLRPGHRPGPGCGSLWRSSRIPSRLGRGIPPPQSSPPRHLRRLDIGIFGASCHWTSPDFFSAYGPDDEEYDADIGILKEVLSLERYGRCRTALETSQRPWRFLVLVSPSASSFINSPLQKRCFRSFSQLLLWFGIVLSFPGTKPARTWKNRTTQERHGRITSKFGRRQYEQQLNDAVGE